MGPDRKCPRCGSGMILRSRRKVLEKLLFFLRPFRCYTCMHRFWGFAPGERG